MTIDPIVEELHRLRAEQMEKFNFDFDAFYQSLKEQEKSLPQPPQAPPASSSKSQVHRSVGPAARR